MKKRRGGEKILMKNIKINWSLYEWDQSFLVFLRTGEKTKHMDKSTPPAIKVKILQTKRRKYSEGLDNFIFFTFFCVVNSPYCLNAGSNERVEIRFFFLFFVLYTGRVWISIFCLATPIFFYILCLQLKN